MKKTINRKIFDTDNAVDLGCRYYGEFGTPEGYEERLFAKKDGQHFIYGVGGPYSKYAEPTIEVITEGQAEEWKNGNAI